MVTVNQQRNQNVLMNGMTQSNKRQLSRENKADEFELPLIELEAVVKATENFSNCNELGQGGFGIVYKVKVYNTLNTYTESNTMLKLMAYICAIRVCLTGKKLR